MLRNGMLKFYDAKGNLRKTINIDYKNTTVDFREIPAGMYFVTLTDHKRTISTTLIKL